jgi:hypothetical protein
VIGSLEINDHVLQVLDCKQRLHPSLLLCQIAACERVRSHVLGDICHKFKRSNIILHVEECRRPLFPMITRGLALCDKPTRADDFCAHDCTANRTNALDSEAYKRLGEAVAFSLDPDERRIVNYVIENGKINASDALRILSTTYWHTAKAKLGRLVDRGILDFISKKQRDPKSHYVLHSGFFESPKSFPRKRR